MAKKSLKETIFGAEENSAAKADPEKLGRFQKIAARMYHTPQLSAKEMGMPSLMAAGRAMSDVINGNYRTIFFVSVLRIDMSYVAIILTLVGIFDVLNDPLAGIVYDRTRTRWGKARPYAFLAPLFYYGATALLFFGRLLFDNDVTDDPGKILFVFLVLLVQNVFETIYKVPRDTYQNLMTPNPQDRMSMGKWQTFVRRWSGDFLAFMFVPLLDLARSGLLDVAPGVIFAGFGVISAAVGAGGSMLMATQCRERILLQPKPIATSKALFAILKNKYALRNFIAGFAGSWWNKGGYDWNYVAMLEIFGGVLRFWPWVIPGHITRTVSLVLVEPFKKLFHGSYRKTVMFMRIWDMFLGSVPAILGLSPKVLGTWWKTGLAFMPFEALISSNDMPSAVLESEIGREISDYTEYMTGDRPDGTMGLLTGLISKVTAPLSVLMTIAVFKWSGYDPNIAGNRPWNQQTVRDNHSMYSKVFFLMNFTDIVPNLLNLFPLCFYDLEGKKKEDMYIALNERRALLAKESGMSAEMEALLEMAAEGNA